MSFNRITGRYRKLNITDSTVILEVNRLSGPLPHSPGFSMVSELKILRDNLFGCDFIPAEDDYSEDYSCASQYLDISMYVFTGIIVVLAIFVILLVSMRSCYTNRSKSCVVTACLAVKHQYSRISMLSFVRESIHTPEILNILELQQQLKYVAKTFVLIFVGNVMVCVPIYILKFWEYGRDDDAFYSTHSYTYSWVLSLAYVTGHFPAATLLFGWIAVFFICYFLFARAPSSRTFTTVAGVEISPIFNAKATGSENAVTMTTTTTFVLGALGFALNIAIVTTINVFYVISTYRPMSQVEHLFIQIGVASFKFLYNAVLLHNSVKLLKLSHESNVRTQLIFSIFNKILIPCIVTAFTNPSCFQNLVVEPNQIQSAYSYDFCSVVSLNPDGSQGSCLQHSVQEVDVIPMTPPFVYNNLCSSVLLSTYIPVYIFMFSFQICFPVAIMLVMPNVEYCFIWKPIRQGMHGALWPMHWNKSMSDSTHPSRDQEHHAMATPEILFKSVTFQLSIMNHLMILLTFGFCSPWLGFVLVASMVVEIARTMFMIGRFVESRLGTLGLTRTQVVNDHAVQILSQVQLPMKKLFKHCLWPLLLCTAVFFAFISWDMTMDASGWYHGIWAPAASICAVLLIRISTLYHRHVQVTGHCDIDHCDNKVEMVTMNAIHNQET